MESNIKKGSPMAESIHLSFKFLYFVMTILAIAWLFSGIRQVSSGEQAIVLRFGKILNHKTTPGLVFALPRPFDNVRIIPSSSRQLSLEVNDLTYIEGIDKNVKQGLHPRRDGGYVIMGNGGVLHVKGTIIYSISDAVKSTLGIADSKSALRRLFCDAAIHSCGTSTLEQLLIREPEKIRTKIKNRMNQKAQLLELGIHIGRIDLIASLPVRAKNAFDKAQSAAAESSAAVARAKKSARLSIQEANREKASILTAAEADKREIISTAEIITNKILAMTKEAKGENREILLRRIHYQTFSQGIQQAGKVVVVPDGPASSFFIPGDS